MSNVVTKNEWAQFERDIAQFDGYVYTTNQSLSSRIASSRQSDAIYAALDFRAKRVIDIACGDGTYSIELHDRGRPASIYAFDAASGAIETARRKAGSRAITFEVASAYEIPRADSAFDIAQIRAALHHMDRPFDAIREALRVAPTVIILEPNGYSLGLKLIEKLSRYHREHNEKSYLPSRLDRYVKRLGAKVTYRRFACMVPFFCPDWLARTMKRIEPLVEAIPPADRLGCSTYIMVASRAA